MFVSQMITPHGGVLINREVDEEIRVQLVKELSHMIKIPIDQWTMCDIECIATGAFSPLTGFMNQRDYESVLHHMKLETGVIWTIPITLPVQQEVVNSIF